MKNILDIKLENCYGIKKFDEKFTFTQQNNVYLIYAPNGTMKTSLRKVFTDLYTGNDSKDLITDKIGIRDIKINAKDLSKNDFLVFESLDENYFAKGDISSLLANEELVKRYGSINKDLSSKKDTLIKEIRLLAGYSNKHKINIESLLAETQDLEEKQIFEALNHYKSWIQETVKEDELPSHLKKIEYDLIFNNDTNKLYSNPDFSKFIQEYIDCYDSIFENTEFFKRGTFDHFDADVICNNLKNHNYFDAEHSLKLKNGKEIKDLKTLEDEIEKELKSIKENPEIEKLFNNFNNLFSTAKLRNLRSYLKDNLAIVEELKNIKLFKKKIWSSYLYQKFDLYIDVCETFDKARDEIREIKTEAENASKTWLETIKIFNSKFNVPFEVYVENLADIVLHNDKVDGFAYKDKNSRVKIPEATLKQMLSQGEKRARYIMNIIFDIEVRKKQKTLLIFDDIADSFDYQNKYAIVEYLHELKENPNFNLIIMTHNFDFYRTLESRLGTDRDVNKFANKTNSEINLKTMTYQKNAFNGFLQKINGTDYSNSILIALVPFIRNLNEYCDGQQCDDYKKLCSLLHQRPDTKNIKFRDLKNLFKKTISRMVINPSVCPQDDKNIYDLILETSDYICNQNSDYLELEDKITLSIGIRLKAEEFMINKIDPNLNIEKTLTRELFNKCNTDNIITSEEKKWLNKVNIMTPENIHLNSFMYEPIIDMSSESLVELYKKLSELIERS